MAKVRRHLSSSVVNAAYERLLREGFVVASAGRPPAGSRPLAPALATALGITDRRARQLIARRRLPSGTQRAASERTHAAAAAVRLQLQRSLGTKVELNDDGGVGVIRVHYSGYAQLQDLLGRMGAL